MSSIVSITSPEVPEPPPGTWSNCLVVDGIAYFAGATASGDDEYAQAKGIFAKLRHLIEAAGGGMADIVKVTIFVTDIKNRDGVWKARQEFFTGDFPVSTLVQVAALARPELRVEIDAIAHIGASRR
jgi:2-iminobutanoate/2-iminopropanoate deaminase